MFARMGTWKTVATVAAAAALAAAPVRAQTWNGTLSGSQQVPANASPATGFTSITLSGNQLQVSLTWSGITGGPIMAGHIHCCTVGDAAGQNVGVAVPFVGLEPGTSGEYSHTFDLLDAGVYTNSFLTTLGGGTALGARDVLINALNGGRAYVNIHNATYPGGEIRSNVALVTPEPTTFALAAAGVAGAGLVARRRRTA